MKKILFCFILFLNSPIFGADGGESQPPQEELTCNELEKVMTDLLEQRPGLSEALENAAKEKFEKFNLFLVGFSR